MRGAVPPEAPVALVTKLRGMMRLAVLGPGAVAAGLRPGMALTDAQGLVPELLVSDHDPAGDRTTLERLADGCLRYTPHVAVEGTEALLLDLTGCLHLHGGEEAVVADIERRLGRMGLGVRAAFAYGPEAALALARFGRGPVTDERAAVMTLPIAALALGQESDTALARAGLTTVGDVARRPQAGIAARFGEAAVRAVRRMTGEVDSPLAFRPSEEPLIFDRRFAEPIARTDFALERLEELLTGAMVALEARKLGGRRFEAIVFRTDGAARRLAVATGTATRDGAMVMRLFRERIETLDDPLDPGFGYDMLRLTITAHDPLGAQQMLLEGGEAEEEREVDALIDRLSTRFGARTIQRFRSQDSYIPELVQEAFPAIDGPPPSGGWTMPPAGSPPLRPLTLFDPPRRIEVLAEVPDGPPHRFRWAGRLYEVSRFEGPERIASEWWRARSGDPSRAAPTRDYYRVEDGTGLRFWLFRHGLYGTGREPVWYLHGLFA